MLRKFKNYLFAKTKITEEQFELLSADLSSRKIKKGTILSSPGSTSGDLFFVSEGLLRSYTIDSFGKEHIIQFAPEDWWIGDRNSFYFKESSQYFIDCIEDSEIVLITKSFYQKAHEIIPGYNAFDIKALHNFIRFMERRINLLLGSQVEERYLDFTSLYPTLAVRVPQWMIASYLGVTPETLSRVRKEIASR